MSSSTIRRTLTAFENRGWVRKEGHDYVATGTGEFVASTMVELFDRFETERRLRTVREWLPEEASGFTVEMCADATLTVADADDPYRPVNRFVSLLSGADRFRFVGLEVTLFEPSKDELGRRALDGMDAEIIHTPRVFRRVRSTGSEPLSSALESGALTVRLHDDLPPYGVGLFDDDVIAVSCYDPESVAVRLLVETDDPEARAWAESVYDGYRRETSTTVSDSIEA